MKSIKDYIKYLAAHGQRYFTAEVALEKLGTSLGALNSQIHRLIQSGDIVSPARGFYLIVPPEDQVWGCLPAADFIPLLMKHWQLDYYVGLLTAASYHGASHQAAQQFYVMLQKQRRHLQCGKISVNFITNKDLLKTPTQEVTVRTGYLKISTPEGTAMDLMKYPKQSGGLNHITTVLTELVEVIEPDKLLALAKQSKSTIWIQRLGYLLDNIQPFDRDKGRRSSELLRSYLNSRSIRSILLDSSHASRDYPIDPIWKVIVNKTVESDI